MEIAITEVKTGQEGIVIRLEGGCHFQRKMNAIGIRENKMVKLVARHPAAGPVVVEVDGRAFTIGRGMAARIKVTLEP